MVTEILIFLGFLGNIKEDKSNEVSKHPGLESQGEIQHKIQPPENEEEVAGEKSAPKIGTELAIKVKGDETDPEGDEEEGDSQPENSHAIPSREYKKAKWTIPKRADLSRLPCLNHILFIILTNEESKQILEVFESDMKGLRLKRVFNLGMFVICETESLASKWFHKLIDDYHVFPLKHVPGQIKMDALRGEICFMEGVRPKKTTVVAERFIKRHLGYKN